ncbi:zinc-finger of mitochondrial splicing suppressor 51-domain-containing protein [Auriculariales sp. MPI-PUGE-AT-0066]|nr:zinc-finger of mitochondrial splicing suppressor 51-domain-containing protein [Auriculariales sp. MPI-PUGE-AT-0066]
MHRVALARIPRLRPQRRTFLSLFRAKIPVPKAVPGSGKLLDVDDVFYPLSESPFVDLQTRANNIRSLAPCPVCLAQDKPVAVKYECPDCGWPTHCSEEHWKHDTDHAKFCTRLRESNEDEHDLRSGRHFHEFDMPGFPDTEQTISLANWDVYWYTRGFPSFDRERSRRVASKVLSYPMSIAGVLHQNSALNLRNQRLTAEGLRSMTALRSNLHVPTGTPEQTGGRSNLEKIRIFILGARAESFLPFGIWQQMAYLFPSANFHIYFIGPQISMPATVPVPEVETEQILEKDGKRLWRPPNPNTLHSYKRTRDVTQHYGFPAYTVPFSQLTSFTGIRAQYQDVHELFQPFDPYTDVFFNFAPGFGMPSPTSPGLAQIAAPDEWGPVVPQVLATKCMMFLTGFSPADVERDVRSLDGVDGVSGEFDFVLSPGENPFGSEKWEVNDFDPRVIIKPNWGIWGIRGKRRDIQEGFVFSL